MTKSMNADDMHSLVDQLEPEEQRRVIESLTPQDPQAAQTVAAWSKQRVELSSLHLDALKEPIPSSLLQAANRASDLQLALERHWRHVGVAASVLLAFGVGWISHGQLSNQPESSIALAKGRMEHEFVRQAGFAHSVYMPEKRHPVEVAASEQDHLVQWLSKRVGKPLKIPKLSAMGYELVGGRLLPGESGARAQFMFQNEQGSRITLYLGAINPQTDSANETGFRYEAGGVAPSFYWTDQGVGYALTGQVDRERLMAIATLVYQQL